MLCPPTPWHPWGGPYLPDLESGMSTGTPWNPWGGPHLPDLESGMSTETPWRLWGNLHFSPEPQPNPTRVVPMTGPGFQPPGP